jgi:RHS repeat-associated protein
MGKVSSTHSFAKGANEWGTRPFGERYALGGSAPFVDSFTGLTNSTVSDEYDFPARSLQTSQGRWISPDPAGLDAADPTNPQSWNRYAYVLNNPLSYVDPTGLECVWDDGSYDSVDDPNTGNPTKCTNEGGTWVGHSFFQQSELPDWSRDPDSDIALYAAQNFTTTVRAKPCSEKQAESATRFNEVTNRVFAGVTAPANLAFGTVKVLIGIAGEAASPETGAAAPLTSAASTRFIVNGGGQAIAGLASGFYAATGNQTAERVSNLAVASTTESGLLTLALTRNSKAAAVVGSIQNGFPTEASGMAALEAVTTLSEGAGWLLQAGSVCE